MSSPLISLSDVTVFLYVFFCHLYQPISLLSSSSTTVSVTPHLCFHHIIFPTSLPCLCFRHLFPESLLMMSPLSQSFPWRHVCFTRWDTVAVAAIPPPIHQAQRCHCCRDPISNMVVKMMSVTSVILSLCHWCPHLTTYLVHSSSPALIVLILPNHYLHFPVSLPCLLFCYLYHPCISTAAVLVNLHLLFHFRFHFPASMPSPSLFILIFMCIYHLKPHNLL